MYLPTDFEETRDEELLRIIEAHPLAALVVKGPGGLDANHLPFLFDGGAGSQKLLRTSLGPIRCGRRLKMATKPL